MERDRVAVAVGPLSPPKYHAPRNHYIHTFYSGARHFMSSVANPLHKIDGAHYIAKIGGVFNLCNYHWGQNDYLPNFYSRRILLGNFVCFVSM